MEVHCVEVDEVVGGGGDKENSDQVQGQVIWKLEVSERSQFNFLFTRLNLPVGELLHLDNEQNKRAVGSHDGEEDVQRHEDAAENRETGEEDEGQNEPLDHDDTGQGRLIEDRGWLEVGLVREGDGTVLGEEAGRVVRGEDGGNEQEGEAGDTGVTDPLDLDRGLRHLGLDQKSSRDCDASRSWSRWGSRKLERVTFGEEGNEGRNLVHPIIKQTRTLAASLKEEPNLMEGILEAGTSELNEMRELNEERAVMGVACGGKGVDRYGLMPGSGP